jgi:tetratricopeptide (TPR) repeat protein
VNYFFSEEELAVNASLDAWDLLVKMGFTESSLYREGNTVRLFCPLHKDQIRRSMIIYTDKNTFKCQYTNCEGHKGGNLLEFYSAYMGVDLPEVVARIRNTGTTETDLVERADKMIQEGSLVDALPLLQKAVQLDPQNEITRCRLAALYLELGDKEAGYQEYMTAAEQYGVKGELDKTLQIYNILVIISPDDVKVRKQLSYLFSRLKREDEAVSQLKWVVDKHIRKGELKDAENICKKMIELCPEYPESHRTLGEVYLKQGNYFDAVEELRTATTHFIRQNNLKKAKETVDQGLKFTPGNPAMKELRARIEKAIELKKAAGDSRNAEEQEFDSWLKDLKNSVGLADNSSEFEGSGPAVAGPAQPASGAAGNGNRKPPAPDSDGFSKAAGGLGRPVAGGLARPAGGLGRPAGGLGRPAGGLGRPAGAMSTPAGGAPAMSAGSPGGSLAVAVSTIPTSGMLPRLAADDPRISLCKKDLKDYTDEQLESLHSHLISMFNEVQAGSQEGILSEFEANVVREFYAAFCLALDSYKSESGKFKTGGGI